MRLNEYLDMYSWSQADLAREASISVQSVARALEGDTITRRNANSIVAAIDTRWSKQGRPGRRCSVSPKKKRSII